MQVQVVCSQFTIHGVLIDQHAKADRPEGLLDRHLHLPFSASEKCVLLPLARPR